MVENSPLPVRDALAVGCVIDSQIYWGLDTDYTDFFAWLCRYFWWGDGYGKSV